MVHSTERIKKYRRWFGWGFIASFLFMMVSALIFADSSLFTVAELVTMVTSITTFLGFVTTTIITWRKEHRESEDASIDPEKKKLELEKLRREIDIKNAAAQEKKKKTTKRRRVV
jgi:hypothetical protein